VDTDEKLCRPTAGVLATHVGSWDVVDQERPLPSERQFCMLKRYERPRRSAA
jgi:hypothetical protein